MATSTATKILLFFILLVCSLSFSQCVGSMSTLVVDGNTVCAIVAAQNSNPEVQCMAYANNIFLRMDTKKWSNVIFAGLAAGNGTMCGLIEDNRQIMCYDGKKLKRISGGITHYKDISVGNKQVCGITVSGEPHCWRWHGVNDPVSVQRFSNVTAGRNFACSILSAYNNSVSCWGPRADSVKGITAKKMWKISAGEDHVCGISSEDGEISCYGKDNEGQCRVPEGVKKDFDELALGSAHTCSRSASNESVICWGKSDFPPPADTQFENIVASGDITCGVMTSNFSVMCWGGVFGNGTVIDGLTNALPRPCVRTPYCACGEYTGYEKLCNIRPEYRMCKACGLSPNTTTTVTVVEVKNKDHKWLHILLICIGSIGCFAGIVSISWFVFLKLRAEARHSGRVHDPENISGIPEPQTQRVFSSSSRPPSYLRRPSRQRSGAFEGPIEFTFEELKSAANNFAITSKIGGGSFGTVYRGYLHGREVAIKRGEPNRKMTKYVDLNDRAFDSELSFLSRVHHKHLVALVGYCEDGDERLLVYEYMPNGTLYDHLHRRHTSMEITYMAAPLNTWTKRIKVALDAARGVEYLHTYAVPPIIHRDIKSSNILLDRDWNARVSDFGLSLMGPKDDNSHLSLTAAGTLGYMDPEYYRLQQLTPKSDVYSFGVLLLELITGKKAIHRGSNGPRNVVHYTLPFIADDDLISILDERVTPPRPQEIEGIGLVCYVAVDCVSLEGKDRPSMTDVVGVLERALALCETPSIHPSSPVNPL